MTFIHPTYFTPPWPSFPLSPALLSVPARPLLRSRRPSCRGVSIHAGQSKYMSAMSFLSMYGSGYLSKWHKFVTKC